jgi:hypothetical protein
MGLARFPPNWAFSKINGKLHLTNTSSLPITGLLAEMESILMSASL